MSRLTRDGTAEPVSRDQILRRERGQVSILSILLIVLIVLFILFVLLILIIQYFVPC